MMKKIEKMRNRNKNGLKSILNNKLCALKQQHNFESAVKSSNAVQQHHEAIQQAQAGTYSRQHSKNNYNMKKKKRKADEKQQC